MKYSRLIFLVTAFIAWIGILPPVAFGTTENGNEMARRLAYSKKGQEKELEKGATGNLYFFRYLKVTDLATVTNKGGITNFQMRALEPSSEMYVQFVVTKTESLKLAATVVEGDCLALIGRVKTASKEGNQIILDPVILRYKDRETPKIGKELLSEVDPNARFGTDTSSGEEVIIKKGGVREVKKETPPGE